MHVSGDFMLQFSMPDHYTIAWYYVDMAKHIRNTLANLPSIDVPTTTQKDRPSTGYAARSDTRRRAASAKPQETRSSSRSSYAPPEQSSQGVRARGSFVRRHLLIIMFALVALLLVVMALFVFRACTENSADQPSSPEEREAAYRSPYTWTNMHRENGRWSYVVNGKTLSRLGVDVSENQNEIDWNAVAADGIDFAMIRLGYRGSTEGDLYLDASFYDNYWGARNAGIDVGIYFFSQAVSVEEAREEAEYVLSVLGGAELQYPIAFDSEETVLGSRGRTAGLTNDEMTRIAQAFCTRIQQDGYTAMVYGNVYDLARFNRTFKESVKIWWAEYGDPTPLHNVDIDMWQYSNGGEVAGISTAVDMNIDLSNCL